jgi:hypothetical protein
VTATPTEAATPAPPHDEPTANRAPAFATEHRVIALIVGGQALWLGWAFSRGWFLQADLSNLADGVGQRLNWSYLSEPLGGHFGPVARLLYWLFDQAGRLNYSVTVISRLVAQAIATVLLYRLLVMLVGRRPLVATIVAVYAFNPLVLASGAWFTSGLGLIPGEILGLLTITEFVRYERSRQLRHAVFTGLLLALTVFVCDECVVFVFVLPLLGVCHLFAGSLLSRAREFARMWRAWLLIYLPLVGVLAATLVFGDPSGAAPLGLGDAYRLLRETWLKSLAPAWVGGPWHWYAGSNDFVSYSLPPDWMVLLGQLGVAVTLALGVQRLGLRSLTAWIMPAVCSIAAILLVGYGRFATYGGLLAITPRYVRTVVPLFAIAAALAFAPTLAAQDTRSARPRASGDRLQRGIRFAAVAAVAAIMVTSLVSGSRFAVRFGESPVHNYFQSLEISARSFGAGVNIYDTAVPPTVISSFEPSHRVSDLLRLAGVPASFDDPRSEPLVVTGDGHLAKAVFVAAAIAEHPVSSPCGDFVHGVGTWTFRLERPVSRYEWFLRLELYQSTPSDVSVEVLDAKGAVVRPITGGNLHLGTLEARNLPLPLFAPVAVRVHSAHASTNLCLSRIAIGGPFAAGAS